LGRRDRAIANGQVTGCANLPGQHDTGSSPGRARQPYLCTNQIVCPDYAPVTNVDLVIYLGSSLDSSLSQRRSVNRCASADLYPVFNNHSSRLNDPVPLTIRLLRIAKPVRAQDCVVLDDTVSSYNDSLAHYGTCVYEGAIANSRVFQDGAVCMQANRIPKDHPLANVSEGANKHIPTDRRCIGDPCAGVNRRCDCGCRKENLDCASKRKIRIIVPQ
jgi:hypothetical protein